MAAARFKVRGWLIRVVGGTLLALASCTCTHSASAYRPFDGTDAAVADVGSLELELGPAQFYGRAGTRYLIAPAAVLILGVLPNLEVVVEGAQRIVSHGPDDEERMRLLDTQALLKGILRQGALQGKSGPSVAVETGVLVPEVRGVSGFGAQVNLIESHRYRLGVLHLNEGAELTRAGQWVLVGSAIFEASPTLVFRPVAEILAEREFGAGSAYSVLFGAIWSASEALSVDGGVRRVWEDDARVAEVRFGFSWGVPVWTRSSF
ncbi:MAG TPA: hypothetical protein VG937_23700 [Polyangiaceae bacterium]|nr:hypothetical protein [Polyangiaceae bacterium]